MTTTRLECHKRCVERTADGRRVVGPLDLRIVAGTAVALTGESGSGKTLASLAAMDVLPPGLRATGRSSIAGIQIDSLSSAERAQLRLGSIGYLMQEPRASMHPTIRVRQQLLRILQWRRASVGTGDSAGRLIPLLQLVGLEGELATLDRYPHQLSGGQVQRAALALAFAGNPNLIVLDEPTTALDPVLVRRLVSSISMLKSKGISFLLISHDLALLEQTADSAILLYAGTVVERSSMHDLLSDPLHPYSQELARVRRSMRVPPSSLTRLPSLTGEMPLPTESSRGCRFEPRCPFAHLACTTSEPHLVSIGDRQVACHLYSGTR